MTDVERALVALAAGSPVVIPTDTVYGIAVDPRATGAVSAVFSLKGRPDDKPLPVLGCGLEQLRSVARFDERAESLAARYWPGPLTLVLPRADCYDHDLGSGSSGPVAVRAPGLDIALELLERSGPLAVTSANRSGQPPAGTVDDARAVFGTEIPVYVDAGPSAGAPSAIVSLVGEPKLLRAGPISERELLGAVGS